jgi:precorrin-2 dehydrogenase/sirohydrochlorin ferrochelatase
MEAFPAFFPLRGARVVIAGEGEGADAKARLLAGSPARVERLSGAAALAPRSYAGAALVFLAGPDPAFLASAAKAAKAAGAPVNVVDHPELSDFHTPAIIDRGQVVAAIGTAGAAPMLAALMRAELEARIPEGMGALVELLGSRREALRAAFADLAQRRAFLRAILDGPVAEAATRGDLDGAGRLLDAAIAKGASAIGKVWLIVAPARRDLLSLRAARALTAADVLVVGDGVDVGVTTLARRDAAWRDAAGTDDAALAAIAADGAQAVVIDAASELAERAIQLAALGAPFEVLTSAAEA